jgi:hypothetical protein
VFDETFCVFKFYLCVQLSFLEKIFPGLQNVFLDQWSCGPIQGWIQHDLVGGGGGGGCSASSGAELCRSCVPPAHQLASLLQSLALTAVFEL